MKKNLSYTIFSIFLGLVFILVIINYFDGYNRIEKLDIKESREEYSRLQKLGVYEKVYLVESHWDTLSQREIESSKNFSESLMAFHNSRPGSEMENKAACNMANFISSAEEGYEAYSKYFKKTFFQNANDSTIEVIFSKWDKCSLEESSNTEFYHDLHNIYTKTRNGSNVKHLIGKKLNKANQLEIDKASDLEDLLLISDYLGEYSYVDQLLSKKLEIFGLKEINQINDFFLIGKTFRLSIEGGELEKICGQKLADSNYNKMKNANFKTTNDFIDWTTRIIYKTDSTLGVNLINVFTEENDTSLYYFYQDNKDFWISVKNDSVSVKKIDSFYYYYMYLIRNDTNRKKAEKAKPSEERSRWLFMQSF